MCVFKKLLSQECNSQSQHSALLDEGACYPSVISTVQLKSLWSNDSLRFRFLIECRCGVVAGYDFCSFNIFVSTHSHNSHFTLLKNLSISRTLSFRGNLGHCRKLSEWHVMTTEYFHAGVCVLTRNPQSPWKPTSALAAARTNSWHFALFLGWLASWFTVVIFRLPFVLHMRQPRANVMVIEIQHRNVKGSLRCFVLSLCVCSPLLEAFSGFTRWPVPVASWGSEGRGLCGHDLHWL